MKKKTTAGSVVIYKDIEDNEVLPTIITHVIGNKNFKYYRVAQNGLGMIMDYIDKQLHIPAFNQNLKASYNSLEEILKEKNKTYKEEALSFLFYYLSITDTRDERLYQLFQEKGYTPDSLMTFYKNSPEETKQLLIKNGFINIFSQEIATDMLNKISSEKELFYFVKMKNNRGNYFNNGAQDIVFDKVNKLVKDEKIRNYIFNRLILMSETFVNDNVKIVLERLKEFNTLNDENKDLFLNRIAPILQGVKRINLSYNTEKEGKSKISSIVNHLNSNPDINQYISEHIENFLEVLIDSERDYNLGHYMKIENFFNKESVKNIIGKIEVHTILKYKDLDSESIEFIVKNGFYKEKFSDGSDATELNINALASHKNTPSYILEKIVEQNRTYLYADSYGKWDVLSALQNPNINIDFLSSKVKALINEPVIVFAAVNNPNCPKEIKNLIRETHGDIITYNTSGYRMVYDFNEEMEKDKKLSKIQKNKNNI